MRIVHQMTLPQSTWNELVNNLTHYDTVKQAKVSAFLKEINKDISVTHEINRTIIESHRLNENAILAALQNSNQRTPNENHSEGYGLQVKGFVDFDDCLEYVDQPAQEDFYQTFLCAWGCQTLEYTTTQEDNRICALAA